MKIIQTERLYLRELEKEDQNELSKVLSDPESMQYYPHSFNQEEVRNWIEWNINNYKQYKHGLWAVVLKEGDIFIGDCGITMQNIDGEKVPEIGFHIIKAFWNKGYATEAAFACKEYAFNVLEYSKVVSYTTLNNIPSQKVAKKLGWRTIRHLRRMVNNKFYKFHIKIKCESVIYYILCNDYSIK